MAGLLFGKVAEALDTEGDGSPVGIRLPLHLLPRDEVALDTPDHVDFSKIIKGPKADNFHKIKSISSDTRTAHPSHTPFTK